MGGWALPVDFGAGDALPTPCQTAQKPGRLTIFKSPHIIAVFVLPQPSSGRVRDPLARVVKLVDAGDSKSPAARRAGSIPAPGTSRLFIAYLESST